MNRYHAHQQLAKKAKMKAVQHFSKSLRLWDRHVGLLYTKNGNGMMINEKGQADCWGVFSCHSILIHVEVEFKSGNAVQTKEQKMWQSFIESMGGCYILCRTEDCIIEKLTEYLKSRKLIE